MAIVSLSLGAELLLVIVLILTGFYVKYLLWDRYHWKRRNIAHMEPRFIVGNTWDATIHRNIPQIVSDIYQKHKHNKVFGMWLYTKPTLLIQDLQILKNILVKDFNHFHDRGLTINEKADPLQAHLFNLSGTRWRNLRVKLSPTFTSGKMKMMFPTMLECGDELTVYLENIAAGNGIIEAKDVLGRYTSDVIASCAFGIQTNSLKNPDAEFHRYGKTIFRPTGFVLFTSILAFLFPYLEKIVTLPKLNKDTAEFFMKAVKDTIKTREEGNIQRKDFMELLIQLKNKGKIEDADTKSKFGVGINDEKEELKGDKFTVEQAAAQAFVFFAAGFDTTSTALTFVLYELARHPEVQQRIQKEFDIALAKNENKLTYEVIQDIEYLDWVLNESMRMYAPVPILFRECTKEYKIEELGVTIKKGDAIMIHTGCFQMDPEYFPEPKAFRPERFKTSERTGRDAYMPFGEGPRNCIGDRFAKLQAKVGLFSILYKYNLEVCKETPIPIVYDPKSFFPTSVTGIPLRITRRKP